LEAFFQSFIEAFGTQKGNSDQKKPIGKGLLLTLHGQYGGKGNRAAHHPHDGDNHGLGGPVQRDELHGDGGAQKIEEGQ